MDLKDLKETFGERDKFAKMSGVVIDSASDGTATGHMDLQPHHLNAAGSAQGGALFTLADTVAAAAANFRAEGVAVTIQSNAQYVRGASKGRLSATARLTADSPKLPSYSVEITDEQGRVVFISTSIFYVKKPYQDKQ